MSNDPGPSITSRVVSGAGWMMGWRMVTRLLGFVSVLLLARLLKPSDFGIVALATSVTMSIDGLSQLGVRDALVRLRDDRPDYYDTAFTFQVARGVLTGTLIAALSLVANSWLGEPRLHDVLLVLAAVAVVAGFENIGVVSFSRTMDFRMQFLLQAGPRLLGFSVTVVLAFMLRSYWALIAGAAASKLCSVAVSYAVSRHRPGFGLAGWRYLLSFSVWTWGGGLALIVWSRSDPYLLGPVLGTGLMGLYMLANEIAVLPVTELVEPVCAALFPGFAAARRGGGEPVSMGLSVASVLALGAIPFSIGISACSGYLVAALLGPRWEAAQPIIAVLAWLCMFSPFSYVAGSVLSAQGEVWRIFTSNALAATIKVSAILAVRHTRDMVLIAITSVFVVGAESLLFIGQLRAAGNYEFRQLGGTLGRATSSSVVTCACLFVLPGTWQHVALGRVAAIVAGGAIGLAAFVVFGACQALQWRLAGRPDGAETRIADLLAHDPRMQSARAVLRGWLARHG